MQRQILSHWWGKVRTQFFDTQITRTDKSWTIPTRETPKTQPQQSCDPHRRRRDSAWYTVEKPHDYQIGPSFETSHEFSTNNPRTTEAFFLTKTINNRRLRDFSVEDLDEKTCRFALSMHPTNTSFAPMVPSTTNQKRHKTKHSCPNHLFDFSTQSPLYHRNLVEETHFPLFCCQLPCVGSASISTCATCVFIPLFHLPPFFRCTFCLPFLFINMTKASSRCASTSHFCTISIRSV